MPIYIITSGYLYPRINHFYKNELTRILPSILFALNRGWSPPNNRLGRADDSCRAFFAAMESFFFAFRRTVFLKLNGPEH